MRHIIETTRLLYKKREITRLGFEFWTTINLWQNLVHMQSYFINLSKTIICFLIHRTMLHSYMKIKYKILTDYLTTYASACVRGIIDGIETAKHEIYSLYSLWCCKTFVPRSIRHAPRFFQILQLHHNNQESFLLIYYILLGSFIHWLTLEDVICLVCSISWFTNV